MRDYDNPAQEYLKNSILATPIDSLDAKIQSLTRYIEDAENYLKIQKAQLKELERVRKLVSPEDEGKFKALKSVGLI